MNCRNCGAPPELFRCSYCLTLTEVKDPRKQEYVSTENMRYKAQGRYEMWTDARSLYREFSCR